MLNFLYGLVFSSIYCVPRVKLQKVIFLISDWRFPSLKLNEWSHYFLPLRLPFVLGGSIVS